MIKPPVSDATMGEPASLNSPITMSVTMITGSATAPTRNRRRSVSGATNLPEATRRPGDGEGTEERVHGNGLEDRRVPAEVVIGTDEDLPRSPPGRAPRSPRPTVG